MLNFIMIANNNISIYNCNKVYKYAKQKFHKNAIKNFK